MQKFKLYSEETNIIKISKEILKDYGSLNKKLFQKENEIIAHHNYFKKINLIKT